MCPHDLFRQTIFILLTSLLIASCASVTPTVYKQNMLQQVELWHIDFTYEPGRVEKKAEAGGGAEVKMVTEGRSPRDLQLRDDIFYRLQDRHGIRLTNTSAATVGEIKLHPVHFYLGGFKSLDVTLVGPNGDTIARIRIKNGDRNATFKEDDEFAIYSADAIADVIKGARR